MSDLKDTLKQAEFSQLSYVKLRRDNNNIILGVDEDNQKKLNEFIRSHPGSKILDYMEDKQSGFSATLIEDENGRKTLAIRGTNDVLNDLLSDDANLAGGIIRTQQLTKLQSYFDSLKSSGIIGQNELISVTGHSLGGFLAQLFTINNQNSIDYTITFNAPGIGGAVAEVLNRLGILPNNYPNSLITNIIADDGINLIAGLGVLIGNVIKIRGLTHGIDNIVETLKDMDKYGLCLHEPEPPSNLVTKISNFVSGLFGSAQAAIQRRDPLTLDLDGDGLETVGINTANPVYFDHDGDGNKTNTGWVKPDDGFLVLDRNGNGTIDDGMELFGDSTPSHDKDGNVVGKAEDGFAALAQEDTNGDGLVNAQDARWSDLRVWRDLNGDGISQSKELLSMGEAGIAAVQVGKTEHSQQLANGNVIADVGGFVRADGTEGSLGTVTAEMGDIDLAEDTFHSQFNETIPLTEKAQELPDMNGSGQVRTLREAASLSTTLASLLDQYSQATTRAEQLALLDQLIIEWGKTSELSVTGDGAYGSVPTTVAIAGETAGSAGYDAWLTRLQTLERFNGRPFANPATGAESVFINLFNERKMFINQAWDALRQSVYDSLLLQTRLTPYIDAVSLYVSDTGIGMDFSGTDNVFQTRHDQDAGEAVRDLLDLQRVGGTELNSMGWDGLGQLQGWLAEAVTTTDPTLHSALVAALADFGYPALCTSGDGTGSSEVVIGADDGAVLNGSGGNDLILGGSGNDALNGGSGSDTLYGGEGDDTYRFNLGDGMDTIIETHGGTGSDTLEFGPAILAGDITITQDGDKLVFSHSNGRDRISIANWFDSLADSTHRLDTVRFADGSCFDLSALQFGTGESDTLNGAISEDILTGSVANDIMVGNGGDDILLGGDGNDWMDGGSGADRMAGGAGDDIFVVDNAGYAVTEAADEGTDTVDSKITYTLGDNVENLHLVGTSDISGTGNALDNVIAGNDGNNTLKGLDGGDTLSGHAGDDTLLGETGNDTLDGGAGNDWLDGGAGDDAMEGGSGNDAYVVDTTGDSVTEYAGQGTDTVFSGIVYTLGNNIENLALTGTVDLNGTGNMLDNVITGNSSDNTLLGLGGNDTLNGGAGADTMLGGTGNDTYFVDNAGDAVFENAGEETDLVRSCITYMLTENVENLTLIGNADIDGTGNVLDNVIVGNSGNNTLTGLEGNDTLDGGIGADVMLGGAGNDTYVVENADDAVIENTGEGTDTTLSGVTYTLTENVENLTLTGWEGINGTGNALDNVIIGNGNNNILDGGAGADTMAGGYGNDTYILENTGDTVTEQAWQGVDTVIAPFDYTLGANVDNLTLTGTALNGTGNALDNVIVGTAADNTLIGLDGNDTLDGGAGVDTLVGGRGNDTYVVNNMLDTTTELSGEGIDTVQGSLTWTLSDNLDNLTLTGVDAIDGTGNELDNVLIGNSAANSLTALAGNDTIDGGGGADVMYGGTGSDTYIVDNAGDAVIENAGEGTDSVRSSITYSLTDNVENLTLNGSAGINGTGNVLDNTIIGNSGSNTLAGLEGNDTLNGGAGADTMIGGTGNDMYVVDNSGDSVMELSSEGTESVQTSVSYTLSDNVENLILTGTSSINGTGNDLDNTITGNAGSNRLDGGLGIDTMAGGGGNDTYVVDESADVVVEKAGAGTDGVLASASYSLSDNVENLTLKGTTDISGSGNSAANTITGNDGDNLLSGLEDDDTLNGGAGNDLLDGGSGADDMAGGVGDDTYIVDEADDLVTELQGEGTDTVLSRISYILGDEVENLTLTGIDAIDGTGNGLDNTVIGNSGDNLLAGQDGNDALTGNEGNDLLDGGAGSDAMAGGSGDDTYTVDEAGDVVIELAGEGFDTVLSSITYTLTGDVENLKLTGTGNLNGTGNELDNAVTGNSGANILDGGAGVDILAGSAGDDTYIVDNGSDIVIEAVNAGTDTVMSNVEYTLADNVENLTLTGSADLNGTGNALANTFIANSGHNILAGLGGNDTYFVDSTSDVVAENAGEGIDTVLSSATYTLSDNVENLTLTGNAEIDGTGNTLNNSIIGNSVANVIDGGAGADAMAGGAGNDTYMVDNCSDTVTEAANAGTDIVYSSVTHTLSANVENLTLTSIANINGTGNILNNTIIGNMANNRLDGSTGADTMVGGTGDDIYVVDNIGDVVTEAADEGTDLVLSSVGYILSANVENLTLTGMGSINGTGNALDNVITGNNGNNVLSGHDGSDMLVGNSGNDTLDGGSDADRMFGGRGNDTYVVDNTGDHVTENADEGTDLVQSKLSYALTSNVENLTLTGTDDIDGIGNSLANVIIGNNGTNILYGLEGNDTLLAGAGSDTLFGGIGNDTLDGGLDADTMLGGLGGDTYVVDNIGDLVTENANEGTDLVQSNINYALTDNVENLTLTGTASINGTGNVLNNIITGNSGGNTLYGLEGNDILNGAAGADTMLGGTGDDTYIVENTGDVVTEVADDGLDLVQSSISYTLSDNVENLTLTGTASINGTGNTLDNVIIGNGGNNVLSGLAGNDTLTGNSGNDTLDGGLDADAMAGGAGNDIYIVDDIGDVVTENLNEGTDLVRSSVTYFLTANVENLTLSGTADIDGTGNALSNIITGNSGVNVLDGSAGADTITAGAGNDTLFGGDGNDALSGDAGNDLLYGDAGNDTLNAGLDADTMLGGTGDDTYVVDNVGDVISENANEGTDLVQSGITYTLTDNVENLTLTGSVDINGTGNVLNNVISGNSGANTLYGLEGNDTLNGAAGADSMLGGTGDDTYIVDDTGDVVIETADEGTDLVQSSIGYTLSANVENLTLTGTASINGTGNALDNVIIGNGGNNVLTGLAGNDRLTGNSGNDTLDGGLAADAMAGGAGNDIYIVDDIGDVVTENLNEGTDLVKSSISSTLNANVENLTLTGNEDINGTGNTLANTITGNCGANVIDGGAGADAMVGGAGDDTYFVENTGDVIIEGAGDGTDTVLSNATYTLSANIENLTLTGTADINGTGNAGDNNILGNSGANILSGDAGNDTLDGGLGADTMVGGTGDDTYVMENGGDVVIEAQNAGNDLVLSSISSTLSDNVENLVLTGAGNLNATGNALNNALTGNSGDNMLEGGGGNDILAGGRGNDTLLGGAGDDRYIFLLGDGSDRIVDLQGNDTLFSGSGLTEKNLKGDRVGNDMLISVTGAEDNMTLTDWFVQTEGVNTIQFDDGSMLDRAGIELLLNRPPVANTDNLTVCEDGGAVKFPAGDLLVNDTDPNPGDILSVLSVGESAVGASVSLVDGEIAYDIGVRFQELAEGQVLHDSFAYAISDDKGAQATGVVDVDIVGVNDAPIVAPDSALLTEDILTSTTGNVLANDFDVDADAVLGVAAAGVYSGTYGSLSLSPDGGYTYTLDNASPTLQSLGRTREVVDHFDYTATDGIAGAASTLDFFVSGTNDAPIVVKPLDDQDFTFNKPFARAMPAGSFIDVDEGDALDYEATLADGSPLPCWLTFDAATQTFSGKTPKEVGSLDIRATATDRVAATGSTEGSLSASDVFRLSISHGNEGLGNGQDAAPAGQDNNWNDGPGTSLGNPGAGNQLATGKDSCIVSEQATSDLVKESSSLPKTTRSSSYLDTNLLDRYLREFDQQSETRSNSNEIFARWQAMNRALAEDAASFDNGAWHHDIQGADTTSLAKVAGGFLGSTHDYGTVSFALAGGSGTSLQTFKGLKEGVQLRL